MLKLIIIATIVFAGCSNQNEISSPPPQWFLEEPQNTESTLFGTGQSSEKNASIENALANLKEKIYISLSSSTMVQDFTANENSANEYKKTVRMKTPPINIQNYKVEKTEFKKGEYYTTVSVAKARVVGLLSDSLIKKGQKIKPQIEQYNLTKNLVTKVKIISQIHTKCNEYIELERFYNALGFAMEENFCQPIINEYNNFATKHKVEIVNTNPVIYDTLSYVFARKFTLLQKAENVITYKTAIETTQVNGTHLAGLTITIMQHNSQEKFEKKCIGNSATSQSQATNAAFEVCLNQAKNQTFEEFFNL
jgi:hypothetical protein